VNAPTSSPELAITRILRAPRALVWKAWADPKQMIKWMGPRHHPASHYENDFRTGGAWRSCLAATDSREELWLGGVYHELVEPERLVFTFGWDGDDGRPENEMLVTITLAEDGAHTKMTLHQIRFVSTEQRDGHNEGWSSCIDRLEEFLEQSRIA
jgi:uncharacterized protein YndB with AHSA1/START domain